MARVTLPAVTRGARVWFAVQLVFFVATIAAPIVQRVEVPWFVRAVGVLIGLGGAGLSLAGYATLGRSHSPGTTPIDGATLVASGVYARLRNPIYAGWILGALGSALTFGSLLGAGIAVGLALYYDLRAREEENHLAKKYPDFRAYMLRVKRFVPGVY